MRFQEFLQHAKERILESWSEQVRRLPAAEALSQPKLVDHLPHVLDHIARSVGEGGASQPASLERSPEGHALARLDEGFALEAVITEYSLLRGCILALYQSEQGASVPLDEIQRFDRAIDEAMRASVIRYHQAHERTLVALDRVSEAALEGQDAVQAERFLPRLLRAVLETTEAVDTATILLREGERLVVRASVGLLEGQEVGYSVAIGEGFAGTVAESRRPLLLRSAATDPLTRSPFIRARGLRALYGVPLLVGDEVIGVAYIGSASAYEFSDEDKLLFRVMVGRASALVAQTQLRERERQARREAEEALAQLDAFIAGAPLGAAFLDRELRYVRINEVLARANGLPVAAHLGRTVAEVLPAEVAARLTPMLNQVLQGGPPVLNLEVELAPPATPGDVRTLLMSYFPVRSRSGEILGVGVTLLDVTERKRATDALERQRQLYESLLKAQSDLGEGFALVSSGRITYVNDALCRTTGYSHQELTSLSSLADLAVPKDRAAYREFLGRLELERPTHYELAILRKDGQPVDLEISTMPMGQGQRLKVTRDVTASRRAARERERLAVEIREARRQLEAVLENMPIGVVVYEAPSGKVILANKRVEQIEGVHLTRDLSERQAFHPDGRRYPTEELPVMRSLRTGEVVHNEEIDLLRPDGRRITVSASSAPIRSAEGQITAAVVAFEDVTLSKQTREDLAEAVQFRDQVVSILGHDLRNPLSTIRAASQLLHHHAAFNDPAQRSIARIDNASVRMTELIGTLLDFSRSRFRGGLPIDPQPTDLGRLVTDLAHEQEVASPESAIEVRVAGDVAGVWDPHRLAQLISNLLGNAVRHGDRERPITATVEGRPD